MSYRSVAHSFLAFELRFPFACTFPSRFEISSRTALFWASAAFSRDRCSPSCRSCLGASANRGTFFLPSCCPLLLCSSCRSNTKSLLLAQIGKPNYRFEKPRLGRPLRVPSGSKLGGWLRMRNCSRILVARCVFVATKTILSQNGKDATYS